MKAMFNFIDRDVVVLAMLKHYPISPRFVALYGLVTCVSVALLGASVGTWIDRRRRLTAARTFLALQNTAVALSCAFLANCFLYSYIDTWGFTMYRSTVV